MQFIQLALDISDTFSTFYSTTVDQTITFYFYFSVSSGTNKVTKLDKQPVSPPSGSFMTYFVLAIVVVVVGYLIYHNKQKVST